MPQPRRRRDPSDKFLSVRVTKEEHARLDKMRQGTSISKFVRAKIFGPKQ